MPHVDRDEALHKYMENIFHRAPTYLSTDDIKLKHVKYVWLLAKYKQTDLLLRQHQVNNIMYDF